VVAILCLVLVSSSVHNALASTELAYDNGNFSFLQVPGTGYVVAVYFSLPSGWSSAIIHGAEVFGYGGYGALLHVESSPGVDLPGSPVPVTLNAYGWSTYALSIPVTGPFYVAVETALGAVGCATGGDASHSYEGPKGGSWSVQPNALMIRALVDPASPASPLAVGGAVLPVDQFRILLPWLALISLFATVSLWSIVVRWRRDAD
jgi:hypothetical protein